MFNSDFSNIDSSPFASDIPRFNSINSFLVLAFQAEMQKPRGQAGCGCPKHVLPELHFWFNSFAI